MGCTNSKAASEQQDAPITNNMQKIPTNIVSEQQVQTTMQIPSQNTAFGIVSEQKPATPLASLATGEQILPHNINVNVLEITPVIHNIDDITSTEIIGINMKWMQNNNKPLSLDLDITACVFDNTGKYKESIYFSRKSNNSGSIIHDGDNAGSNYNNESITIHKNKLPLDIGYITFVLSSYSGASLNLANTIQVNVSDINANPTVMKMIDTKNVSQHIVSYDMASIKSTPYNAIVFGNLIITRSLNTTLLFHHIFLPSRSNCITSLIPFIQSELKSHNPNIVIQHGLEFPSMIKGEVLPIQDSHDLPIDNIALGLGWNECHTGAPIDIDASCIMVGDNGVYDIVYFGQKISKCNNVRSLGDNLTGAGDGDDETILANLQNLPLSCNALYFTITAYSANRKLKELKDSHVRLIDTKTQRELLRYELDNVENSETTAMIMCKVIRNNNNNNNTWSIKALGIETKGRRAAELVNQINLIHKSKQKDIHVL